MLKYTDDLSTVADAYRRGKVAAENLHIHVAPRLEGVPEQEIRKLLNDLETAVYTLAEPNRQARILDILEEANRVASNYSEPDRGST